MVMDEPVYKEVINQIISRHVRLLGSLAVVTAQTVLGLELNDDGRVIALSEDPIDVIHNLVLKYEEIEGKNAAVICKIMISKLKEENPGLKLPLELM